MLELGSCPANPFIGLAGEQTLLQAGRCIWGGWFGVWGHLPHQLHGMVCPQLSGLMTWPLPSQFYLCCQQFYAMFMKRAMYSWRNWKMVVAQFLVPLIFTAFALIVAKTFPGPRDSSLLRLTLDPYGQTIVPFSVSGTAELPQRLAKQYIELLDAHRQSPLEVLGEGSGSTPGAGGAQQGFQGALVWVL